MKQETSRVRIALASFPGPETNGRVARLFSFAQSKDQHAVHLRPKSVPFRNTRVNRLVEAGFFSVRRTIFRLFASGLTFLSDQKFAQITGYLSHLIFFGVRSDCSKYSVLFVSDLPLLPGAIRMGNDAKIFFDSRDLSEAVHEESILWRGLIAPGIRKISKIFFPLCQQIFVPSPGIRDYLAEKYQVKSLVIRSIPSLDPIPTDRGNLAPLTLVYSGRPELNRGLIRLAWRLRRFPEVNLFLQLKQAFFASLLIRIYALFQANVTNIPAVALQKIPTSVTRFSFGLVLLPSKTKNLELSLPNKFYEYLLAGIPIVCIGGSEVTREINRFGCGLCFQSGDETAALQAITELDGACYASLLLGVERAQQAFLWANERQKLEADFCSAQSQTAPSARTGRVVRQHS